jgi:hypothetical protein
MWAMEFDSLGCLSTCRNAEQALGAALEIIQVVKRASPLTRGRCGGVENIKFLMYVKIGQGQPRASTSGERTNDSGSVEQGLRQGGN